MTLTPLQQEALEKADRTLTAFSIDPRSINPQIPAAAVYYIQRYLGTAASDEEYPLLTQQQQDEVEARLRQLTGDVDQIVGRDPLYHTRKPPSFHTAWDAFYKTYTNLSPSHPGTSERRMALAAFDKAATSLMQTIDRGFHRMQEYPDYPLLPSQYGKRGEDTGVRHQYDHETRANIRIAIQAVGDLVALQVETLRQIYMRPELMTYEEAQLFAESSRQARFTPGEY
jgi:hypothetical protein